MSRPRFLFISGHDFRSRRKASVHFIAENLSRVGDVQFFSVGFSPLSMLRKDPRSHLYQRANRVETVGSVEAFLQKSWFHPFRLPVMDDLLPMGFWFQAHARALPSAVRGWIMKADVVFFESGLPISYFPPVKALNPKAKTVYLAADRLDTIGCSRHLQALLLDVAPQFDLIRVPSPVMRHDFGEGANVAVIPHGYDAPASTNAAPSPYKRPVNAVSVGSMLFDAELIRRLCALAPDVQFHVIGAGAGARGLSAANLTVYDEMPFQQTRPFIEHADVGVAPYAGSQVSHYLADTSLKLMQFAASGLPAICPRSVAGANTHRFGYDSSHPETALTALRAALAHGRFQPIIHAGWQQVSRQLIDQIGLAQQ